MGQDKSYPDPAQLQAYAEEPIPFTEVNDLTLRHDGTLEGGRDNVEYVYSPSYIRVQPPEGDAYEVTEHLDAWLDHAGCWTRRMDVEIQEDYVCVTGFTSDKLPGDEESQFEAFYTLASVTIIVA